jgi:hypothetical protein
MDHPEGASETSNVRLGFDRRVRLEFHGSKISSDGGLLLFRELDEVLGLHDIAGGFLRDTRTGHNRLHSLVGLLGLPVAEYEACDHVSTRATSISMVRYRSNDYSVPVDRRVAGSALDRLTHHVHILEMNGESYRLKHSRKARQ